MRVVTEEEIVELGDLRKMRQRAKACVSSAAYGDAFLGSVASVKTAAYILGDDGLARMIRAGICNSCGGDYGASGYPFCPACG